MKSLVFARLVLTSVVCLIFIPGVAHADPFDAFVGTYIPTSVPEAKNAGAPDCNRYDFLQLQSFEVRADRTGERQTHELRLVVPNGYSMIPVVPGFKDPSSLDPTIGTFGGSDGGDMQAWTTTGSYGASKNEILKLTITKVPTPGSGGFHLEIANELKKDEKTVLAACYYQVDLAKQ